jgi:hypothetical protein
VAPWLSLSLAAKTPQRGSSRARLPLEPRDRTPSHSRRTAAELAPRARHRLSISTKALFSALRQRRPKRSVAAGGAPALIKPGPLSSRPLRAVPDVARGTTNYGLHLSKCSDIIALPGLGNGGNRDGTRVSRRAIQLPKLQCPIQADSSRGRPCCVIRTDRVLSLRWSTEWPRRPVHLEILPC